MKFNDFQDSATLHETFVFLAQNQGLSGIDPRKPQKHEIPLISQNPPRIHHFRRFPANSPEKAQKTVLERFWGLPGAAC